MLEDDAGNSQPRAWWATTCGVLIDFFAQTIDEYAEVFCLIAVFGSASLSIVGWSS